MSAKCRQQCIRSYDLNSSQWWGLHNPSSEELPTTSQSEGVVEDESLSPRSPPEEQTNRRAGAKSGLLNEDAADVLKLDDTCLVLRACAKEKDLYGGTRMHAHLIEKGLLEQRSSITNAVICMYVKCGLLERAELLLDAFPAVDLHSWTALIGGYVQRGQGQDALGCFERMQEAGLSPDAVTFACVLTACGNIGALDKGDQIHDEIVRQGLLSHNIVLSNALVNMYVKCGAVVKARRVLEKLSVRDVITWTALIAGYAKQGHGQEALNCFAQLEHEGLSPDAATFACILKACGTVRAADKGAQIHIKITKQGLHQNNIVLGNALVDMYAKCGDLSRAREVLEELPTRDVMLWTTLITGYVQHGQGEEALNCLEKMQEDGHLPNEVTFACALKACGITRAVEKGEQIHDEILRWGLLGDYLLLGNALVEMYATCGALKKARRVLEDLPAHDVVSWNTLIMAYIQQGEGEEALNSYNYMLGEGLQPDPVTFSCILKACGSIDALDKGEQIHDEILSRNLLGKDIMLGNALVDMYAKCGALEKAQKALEALPSEDVVTWNTLISAYAKGGRGHEALECFERMQVKGISPNVVSYACILKAIGNIGEEDKGEETHVELLRHGLPGNNAVLGRGLVDMYAKCGALARAAGVLRNVKVQRWTFDQTKQLDKCNTTAYFLMTNMCIVAEMQQGVDKIKALRVANEAGKKLARSWWVDVRGNVHSTNHRQDERVYSKLQEITDKLQEGHAMQLDGVSRNAFFGHQKMDMLCGHSVILALACALVNTSEGEMVRILDNMRVCGSCHCAISLVSRVEKRTIVVRDVYSCHGFERGRCSCER